MNQGWIKLYRKILDSSIWEADPLCLKAFIWLLLSANHKPRRVYISNLKAEITVNRGEIITSYRTWGENLKYREMTRGQPWKTPTVRRMRTIRRHLEDVQMITGVTTEGCLHLVIENFDLYQSDNKITTGVTTGETTRERHENDTEQEGKKGRSNDGEEYQPKYTTVLTILHGIEGWPVDPKKDDNLIQRNKDKHSLTLDQLTQAALELATWFDDNPGEIERPKANPRMRFNTFARNRAKWDRESGVAGDDGQPVQAITAGRIRQDLTSYLIRAANGQMNFEQLEAAVLSRYRDQTVPPEAILEAWELAQREFGGDNGR